MVALLVFADKKLHLTLRRIKEEAQNSGFFDKLSVYDQRTFDRTFWRKNKSWIKNNPRGYGYWIWKPYLISRELNNLKYGDVLIYLDAGCVINKQGKHRLMEYIDSLSDSNYLVCFEHASCYERQYCKYDFLNYFSMTDNDSFLFAKQKMSCILIIRVCQNSYNFVNEWFSLGDENRFLLDDTTIGKEEHSDFIEHRHDQSLFSFLCWKHRIGGLPQQEVEPSVYDDWDSLYSKPFWAARKKVFKNPFLKQKLINLKYRINKILHLYL